MKKKLCGLTERHLKVLKDESKKYQTSESESLRRIIDFYIDYHEKIKSLQIQIKADK